VTLLWIAVFVLTAATLMLLLGPLLRRDAAHDATRADFDMAVYRDQLAEVDRDLERGLLDPEQAEAARVEVKRRILAATGERSSPQAMPQSPSPRPGRSFISLILVAVTVPAAALGLYLALGMPQKPDQPLATRQQPVQAAQSPSSETDGPPLTMEEAVAQLAKRLEAQPQNVQGWLLLGRSYVSMERYPDAVDAYSQALKLEPGRADIASAYGEAMVASMGGEVSYDASQAFEAAIAHNPMDPRARYYLALYSAQQGDGKSAMQGWVDLVAVSPPDSPWLRVVNQQIERAAEEFDVDPASIKPSAEAEALANAAAFPAPSQAEMDAAADMSDQEREEMIRSMVDRLAARLEQEPDDLAGWQRLARAYEVLGETEKAKDARARVEALTDR